MPELPEVETVARGLRARLTGRRIEALELLRASVFEGEAPDQLRGGVVTAVLRAGKYLVLEVASPGNRQAPRAERGPLQLLFHLGMTGRLVLYPAGHLPERHTHAVLTLAAGGEQVEFRDPRRFGRIALALAPAQGGLAPALGVAAGAEPLEIDPESFVALFRGRHAPIKSALLNQSLLRGLGNIYADESLHRAGIDPRARALSRPRLLRLRRAIRAVLRQAIAAGGSSISDYRDSAGQPGWFHLQHRVYGRTGAPCPRCRRPIRRLVLAGRSAHFCAACQSR